MMLVCQSCARDLGAGDVAPICRGACETCGGGLGVSGWPLIELPRAVVALAEHAERMRKMSDEVQGYSRALDGTDGTAIMELPRIIIPARKEAAE
jgi:hypothetical protein